MPVPKPLLAVVTGRAGAGKSTLAKELAIRLGLPLISRDGIKEGMMWTSARLPQDADITGLDDAERSNPETTQDVQMRATSTFFATIGLMVANGTSLVAEAAFQHPVWSIRLGPLLSMADVRIVVCDVPFNVAMGRAMKRAELDPERERSHPMQDIREEYEPPRLSVPTLTVDTSKEPDLAAILAFLD